MSKPTITKEMLISTLLEDWPELIPYFNRRKMLCVGCSMAIFDTINDAANNYLISPDIFIQELQQEIQKINDR